VSDLGAPGAVDPAGLALDTEAAGLPLALAAGAAGLAVGLTLWLDFDAAADPAAVLALAIGPAAVPPQACSSPPRPRLPPSKQAACRSRRREIMGTNLIAAGTASIAPVGSATRIRTLLREAV